MLSRTSARLRTLSARSFASATSASRPALSGLSAPARERAERLSAEWKGTSATGESTKNFIGGEFVESKASQWIDVVDPVCWRCHYSCRKPIRRWHDICACRLPKHCLQGYPRPLVQSLTKLSLLHQKPSRPGAKLAYSPASVLFSSRSFNCLQISPILICLNISDCNTSFVRMQMPLQTALYWSKARRLRTLKATYFGACR